MRLTDIKNAWNKQADERHQWETLNADERVEFALYLVGKVSHDTLSDLYSAVYEPELSGISVAHALGHVKQSLHYYRRNDNDQDR